ncbi:uncharacterized protein LOC101735496 [Bombyx mori]|uniref:Uncharacterized protein n=1 Tax=Bombyx mori TaxID=7091 RepID=A0A8R1WFT9_BOMMO|nr:uncharacterized protein LOC101735496 [Bombyx mori]
MSRMRKRNIKTEDPEPSTSTRIQQEHDLAYYIHDRVELMHQIFSVLKPKELKAMAPDCVRNVSIDDLQELCTEELLGISSKRLLAILDGAEPPSDTESSSRSPSPQLETISLDSISSDEEILNEDQHKKKKHKHHRKNSKLRLKDRKKHKGKKSEDVEQSAASRAGLTVLELLELQARARAIRAQLQQERETMEHVETSQTVCNSSDNEVEIKEEPPEVLVISSEDEKPDIQELQKHPELAKNTPEEAVEAIGESPAPQESAVVTKRCNDLIIKVPQKTHTRKIKLKRNKITASVQSESVASTASISVATTEKRKKKKKKRDKQTYNIDNDEITLQLSDSEKMDLLQDLEKKHGVASETDSDSSEDMTKEANNGTALQNDKVTEDALVNTSECVVNADTESSDKGEGSIEEGEIVTDNCKDDTEICESVESAGDRVIEVNDLPVSQNNPETVDLNQQHSERTQLNDKPNLVYGSPEKTDSLSTNTEVAKQTQDSEEIIEETVCISDDESTNDVIQIIDEVELSDDSCSEVSLLSKEPTAQEIAALSARIDEMDQNDVDDDASEQLLMSWKDRYVESAKVKKVLTVSNIFNALRKKNIDLKKKIQECDKPSEDVVVENKIEDGTLEQYNNLESTAGKFSSETLDNVVVTANMKKDAKVLLKMYKKLLKYNDMTRVSKKKKKKDV